MRTYKDLLHLLQQAVKHNASDVPFKGAREYSVTLITKEPEPDAIDEILKIPYSSLDQTFVSDGMNHFVFSVYL